jgi:hypothetical protein
MLIFNYYTKCSAFTDNSKLASQRKAITEIIIMHHQHGDQTLNS